MSTKIRSPRAWIWVLAGTILFQVGWALVVPPYGGLDEIDHAYRATSVARGHITDALPTEHGRGALIRVPADIVQAAHGFCRTLKYMERDNCSAVTAPDKRGEVLVACAPFNYNPAYYLVVGTLGRPFHGDAAVYAMRLAGALCCAIALGLSLWLVAKRTRSPWPSAGISLASTPVVLYASANVAPNGLDLCAAVLMWTAALSLLCSSGAGRLDWWLLAGGMATVATLHTLGPLWCLLSAGVLLTLPSGRRVLTETWRRRKRDILGPGALVLVVGALDVAWTISQGTNIRGGDDGHFGSVPLHDLLGSNVLWVFQTTGTLPFRNEQLPMTAMALSVVVFLVTLTLATARAVLSERLAGGLVVVGFFTVGSVLTVLTYDRGGLAWQGRYVLPFAFALPLGAGWIIGRQSARWRPVARTLLPITWASVVTVQGWGLMYVLSTQRSWYGHRLGWAAPSPLVIALISAVAGALVLAGARHAAGASNPGEHTADRRDPEHYAASRVEDTISTN